MKCPICDNIRMREVEKDGVAIDVCPECKGVWLDRGELDKLMSGVRSMQSEVELMEASRQEHADPGTQYGSAPASEIAQSYGGPDRQYSRRGIEGEEAYAAVSGQPVQVQAAAASSGGAGGFAGQQAYGMPVPPQYGSVPEHDDYGIKEGYNRHGVPYKKKKTVLDVLGDLFE